MTNSPYPEFIARFYDLIYSQVRHATDQRFYFDRIAEARGPVLEVGVGTGRFFVDALEGGCDIYGIDNSSSMIEVLKGKIPPQQHYRVMVENLVEFENPMKFELIIAPFRMFSHLVEVEDQLRALERVSEHLAPGGSFIFDLYVPDYDLLLKGLDHYMDFEAEYQPGKKVRRFISMKADPIFQISHVTMVLEWTEMDGTNASAAWDFPMRYFFRYEIEHLIRLSPLRLERIYGDFKTGPLRSGSKEFIIVCRN